AGKSVAQRLGRCPTCSARRWTLHGELVAAPAGHDRVSQRGVERDDRGIRRTRVDLAIAIGPGPAMYPELQQPADALSAVHRQDAGYQDAEYVLARRVHRRAADQPVDIARDEVTFGEDVQLVEDLAAPVLERTRRDRAQGGLINAGRCVQLVDPS